MCITSSLLERPANDLFEINGLCVIENFITEEEELYLIEHIDRMEWSGKGIG